MKFCNKVYLLKNKDNGKIIYALDSNMNLELEIIEHKEV